VSLKIDVSDVSAVLLADGWHEVANGSFSIDSYEFFDGNFLIVGGGQCQGVPSSGFEFVCEDDSVLAGPLTSVHAMRIAG
jgi:hypothetical protein